MYCSKCGKENNDKALFCAKCGTPIYSLGGKEKESSAYTVIENSEIGNSQDNNINIVEEEKKVDDIKQTRSDVYEVGMKKRKPVLLWVGIVAILVGAIFTIAIIVFGKGTKDSSYNEKIDLGHKYLIELDYENARIAFEDAIKIDPKKKDAYINLAEVYVKQGDLEKALEVLEEAKGNIKDSEEIKIIDNHKEIIEAESTKNVTGKNNQSGNTEISPETNDVIPTESVDNITTIITPTPTPEPTPTPLMIEIDNINGLTKEEGQKYLEQKGLKVEWDEEYDENVPAGYIIRTNPETGTPVVDGSEIKVYVSKGLNPESFKEKLEKLVYIFTWKMAGNISIEDTEYMLLDAYLYSLSNDSLDYIFDIDIGNALPPEEVDGGLRGMNDDGTVPYIRSKLSDMKYFIKNVLGEKVDIEEGYMLYGTYINKDGYLTEWGDNWFISYEGAYQEITDFSYTYDNDIIIASYKITSYWADETLGINQYTTYWKPNSKSPIGYTLQKAEKEELYNGENNNSNGLLTEEQAFEAVKNYCYTKNPTLKDWENTEYVYWTTSTEDNEIVVLYRAYTGAIIRYYVNRSSWDVYVTEFVPGITDEEEYTGESFNIEGYLN